MPRKALKPSADRILAAAEALFARRGYAEVSLRDLIAAARVSTTAFYARFDSKAAVLDAIVQRLFAELHADAAVALREARSLDDGIALGVDLLCRRLGPRKPLVRLAIAETGAHASSTATRARSYALLAAFLASQLRGLAQRARIGAPDPEALAWAVVGALDLQIVRWAVWGELSLTALRSQLLATARAVLPQEASR